MGRGKRQEKGPGGQRTVDLHGCTVEESKNRVLDTIDGCLRDEIYQIRIIHGFGTGKVKEAVHELLRSLKHVKEFRQELGNAGVTIAYL
jgi:DNA mismatch repair protein MutS2